jgi:hypothetical protein
MNANNRSMIGRRSEFDIRPKDIKPLIFESELMAEDDTCRGFILQEVVQREVMKRRGVVG